MIKQEKSPIKTKYPLFICILANTQTSLIPGISAAGKEPSFTFYTPVGDSEIIHTGNIITPPILPMTPPLDTPTPALITKSVLNLIKIPYLFIDTGLVYEPDESIPKVKIGTFCGQDIRTEKSVLDMESMIEKSKKIGYDLARDNKNDFVIIGESTPGGTTTAQAVLKLLGYDAKSSSSYESNPMNLKEEIISFKFNKYNLFDGCFRNEPLKAVESCGDPMMITAIGIIIGLKEYSPRFQIVLAGGTQMISVYTVLKHLNINLDNIFIITTKYVFEDKSCNLKNLESEIGLNIKIVDPEFEKSKLPGIQRYTRGTIKEGAGAGGMIYLAHLLGISTDSIISELEKICNSIKAGQK